MSVYIFAYEQATLSLSEFRELAASCLSEFHHLRLFS